MYFDKFPTGSPIFLDTPSLSVSIFTPLSSLSVRDAILATSIWKPLVWQRVLQGVARPVKAASRDWSQDTNYKFKFFFNIHRDTVKVDFSPYICLYFARRNIYFYRQPIKHTQSMAFLWIGVFVSAKYV